MIKSELNQNRIVVGIPARMGSTRFPGKPLCKIKDMTMIQHCYERCKLSIYASELLLFIFIAFSKILIASSTFLFLIEFMPSISKSL